MFKIIPYKAGSTGARNLATALGGHCLRLQGSRYRRRPQDRIINWGNTNPPYTQGVLNGTGIRTASNKRLFFQTVRDRFPEIIPAFWTRREDIPDDAFPVLCRTVLSGHSGQGIVIASNRDGLVPAPLYVKYVKKQDEYRIHVGRGPLPNIPPVCQINCSGGCINCAPEDHRETVVIDTQKKARRLEHENPNWQIRNHANGFIYAREGVDPPECVNAVAMFAFECSDLDFGAVDVIYNARDRRAYVLEINTAPGITGTTVENYASFFRRF